eukprot:TRINITY_DN7463_c0_g3_i2.p1 TRINITY_DN7463_c0_g3~~TRINITY_DN7463_c0_g3_i2.p1  ORF type:complete len:268 (-),score=86.51 TRINITY_DN7463_c0_g3_i2:249-1052(-)
MCIRDSINAEYGGLAAARTMEAEAEANALKAEGNKLFTAKEYLKAAAMYKKAIAKCPSAALHSNMAAALLGLNKFAAALKEAEKSVELDPTFERGVYRTGLALSGLDRYEEAVEAFSRVLEINSTNSDAIKKRAVMVKSAVDAHTKAGTEPPAGVAQLWEELQQLRQQQQKAAQEAQEAKDAEKKLRREKEDQEAYLKARDHCVVGSQYHHDNPRAVVESAMTFLRHPQMQQFTDEQKMQFLMHKGVEEADAREAVERVAIESAEKK